MAEIYTLEDLAKLIAKYAVVFGEHSAEEYVADEMKKTGASEDDAIQQVYADIVKMSGEIDLGVSGATLGDP